MIVHSRAPGDQFSFDLFTALTKTIPVQHDSLYMWSSAFKNKQPEIELPGIVNGLASDNIIICVRDNFSPQCGYQPRHDKTVIADILDDVAGANPRRQFVICTALENLDAELVAKNIVVVPMGGDITNQASSYPKLTPVLNKDLTSTKSFISLNRNPRLHRLSAVSLILALNLNQTGYITFLGSSALISDDYLEHVPWEFTHKHSNVKRLFIDGFKLLYQQYSNIAGSDYNIYSTLNDNVTNFNKNLRSVYKQVFVEIVTETTFAEQSFLLTEKTLNSIYGCCFPIFIAGKGTVNFLRNAGLDVFDDVIDHSYDSVTDPVLRMNQAIQDNMPILKNPTLAKNLWEKCRCRFEKNLVWANSSLYQYYKSRAELAFKQVTWVG